MHNKLVKQREQELQLPHAPSSSTSYTNQYGEDSLEIAPTPTSIEEDESVEVDDLIFEQSDLAERIIAAEKKFSTSSINTTNYYSKTESSEYFEYPALYRVSFMGSTTEEMKKQLFKKLSQGFIHVLQQQSQQFTATKKKNLSYLGQPIIPFKEIKHNLLLLSEEEEPNLLSDTFEDIGVSMIEADFTWNSNAVNYSNDANNLLLQYAWHQCPNPRELPSAWLENEIFNNKSTKFTGSMYPERTPNGIDLCVYFYQGPENESRTKNDLELLCLLRKLGIYVLPLTTTRDEQTKSHFADLLTEHKVRCLDLGNLEVGLEEPSFFHHKQKDRISRLQGMECTQLNVPRVATYQILAVDQFCGIENKAIFQLLKRTRERQVIRDEFKKEAARMKRRRGNTLTTSDDDGLEEEEEDDDYLRKSTTNLDSSFTASTSNHSSSSSTSSIMDDTKKKKDSSSLVKASIFSLIGLLLLLLIQHYISLYQHDQQLQHWTVSFHVDSNFQFTLNTRDSNGNTSWSRISPPIVWLNNELNVPIKEIDDEPGYYQLLFDPFDYASNSDKFISLVFSVNTTNLDTSNSIIYTTAAVTNPTFLLLNSNYSSSSSVNIPSSTNKHSAQHHHHQQQQITNNRHNDIGVLKKTWKTFVFITNNYSNLYSIMIKK